MRRIGLAVCALAIVVAACGDSDDAETATTEEAATATTEAPATTATPTTAAPTTAAPTTTAAAADTSEAPAASEGAVEVELIEWSVAAPTEIAAGTVEFSVTNGGEFNHEFVLIKGDGYASLPTNEIGTVQEDQLEDGQFIARIPAFAGGTTETITLDLEPGNYVILCNIEFGPNSHAGAGQTLDVTVG